MTPGTAWCRGSRGLAPSLRALAELANAVVGEFNPAPTRGIPSEWVRHDAPPLDGRLEEPAL